MGVTMDAVMKYTFAPLSGFWSGFSNFCEVVGYARAASHLSSLGYHEEAKHCMMQVNKLRSRK